MLTKMVDGEVIVLSETEENQIRAFWAMNQANPDYSNACAWDGVSEPYYDMVCARQIHRQMLEQKRENAYNDVCKQIEMAEEDNIPRDELLQKRKNLRNYVVPDLSSCNTLDDLKLVKFEV